MSCPLLTAATLKKGVWIYLSSKKWRPDFHNRFFSTVTASVTATKSVTGLSVGGYGYSPGSIGPTLWDDIVEELKHWKALRPSLSKTSLNSRASTINVVIPSLPPPTSLSIPPYGSTGPLGSLFSSALSLKPTKCKSPVFASKLCHMICPSEFPIYDGKFIGKSQTARASMLNALAGWVGLPPAVATSLKNGLCIPKSRPLSYDTYRVFVLCAWDTLPAPQQALLKGVLDTYIKASGIASAVWPHFPYRTKIPELCLF